MCSDPGDRNAGKESAVRSLEPSRESAHPHPVPEWFSGPVYVQPMTEDDQATGLEILGVFFDAGARTLPHTHSTDQLLYFIEGVGVVGTQGDTQVHTPGGMAFIPAGEWHWHGAVPTSAAGHLSIRPGGPSAWPPDVPMLDWDTYMDGVRDAT